MVYYGVGELVDFTDEEEFQIQGIVYVSIEYDVIESRDFSLLTLGITFTRCQSSLSLSSCYLIITSSYYEYYPVVDFVSMHV